MKNIGKGIGNFITNPNAVRSAMGVPASEQTVDVKASDRIKDGTKYYEIIAINTVRDSKGDDCYTVASCLYRE